MAEAITTSGQLSLRWASNELNAYMNKLLKTENVDYVIYNDTDSVVGGSVIKVNGKDITIENYYDSISDNFMKNEENNYVKIVNDGDVSLSMSETGNLENKKIKYIMKHKVKKKLYKIKVNNNEVIVTEDHSVIVYDGEKYLSVKPQEINKEKHKLISIIYNDTERLINGKKENKQ